MRTFFNLVKDEALDMANNEEQALEAMAMMEASKMPGK